VRARTTRPNGSERPNAAALGRNPPMKNLTRNLGEVVSRGDSVAEFCRRVAINRQQFNKYLAGTHMPSLRSMVKIAEVCGLEVQDFELETEAFIQRLHGKSGRSTSTPADTHFQNLEGFARNSGPGLKPFLGTYFRYHHSSIFPGMVIRAIKVIYKEGDFVCYVTVEHMPAAGDEMAENCRFSYRGICYLMGNRVFMTDYERRQQNEMTSTILMPQFRTPIHYMFGLLSGIAATAYGQPFSARVAFERQSDDSSIRKSVIRQATMLKPDDRQIPRQVREYLGEPVGAVLLAST
jgi:hypothetical protein